MTTATITTIWSTKESFRNVIILLAVVAVVTIKAILPWVQPVKAIAIDTWWWYDGKMMIEWYNDVMVWMVWWWWWDCTISDGCGEDSDWNKWIINDEW